MAMGFLKKLFNTDEDSTAKADISVQHGPAYIANQLQELSKVNTLIEGQIVDNGKPVQRFTTGITSVDTTSERFYIEHIKPANVANTLRSGDELHFTVNHFGERIQFKCHYAGRHADEQNHSVDFPSGIEHVQLRNAFRLKISRVSPVYLQLERVLPPPPESEGEPNREAETEQLNGYVSDISVTGARLHLEGNNTDALQRGERYDNCEIKLADTQTIHCAAQLMHWRYDDINNETQLGLQFDKLSPPQEKTLARFISDIQRKYRALNH